MTFKMVLHYPLKRVNSPTLSHKTRQGWGTRSYFPMQNLLKIKFRMSSVVVAPVIASSGRSAL